MRKATGFIRQIPYINRYDRTIVRNHIDYKIAKIVAVGRMNNERDQITGALLFSGGYFAQVIQGPTEALERLFARISTDNRHRDVTLLSRGNTTERTFPEWAMGLLATNEEEAAATALMARVVDEVDGTLANEIRELLQQSVARHLIWG
jgi:hypothetical protein